jgi:hypothetical protein
VWFTSTTTPGLEEATMPGFASRKLDRYGEDLPAGHYRAST